MHPNGKGRDGGAEVRPGRPKESPSSSGRLEKTARSVADSIPAAAGWPAVCSPVVALPRTAVKQARGWHGQTRLPVAGPRTVIK